MLLVNVKKCTNTLALILFVAAFLFVAYKLFHRPLSNLIRPGGGGGMMEEEAHTTAKLLHAANAMCFGSRNCGFTVRQMEKFGRHAHLIDYIECGDDKNPRCQSIKGYPTWHVGGKELLGDQPLHTLREAAEAALRGANEA